MKSYDKQLLAECVVQAYRASGPGGQHVAKTSSAIRLIHQPTGIVVTCQQERSQYLNKLICLKKLRKKIAERTKKPKKRIPTKKPRAVKEKILKGKALRAKKKKLRAKHIEED